MIKAALEFANDSYSEVNIDRIYFGTGFYKGKAEIDYGDLNPIELKPKIGQFTHNKLPIISPFDDMLLYGRIVTFHDESKEGYIKKTYTVQPEKGKNTYYIVQTGNEVVRRNEVKVFKNGLTLFSYTDMAASEQNLWIRTFNEKEYVYDKENNLVVMSQDKKISKFIESIGKDSERETNFVTLDIETFKDKDYSNDANSHSGCLSTTLTPYVICYHTGSQSQSFNLSDYSLPGDMLKACFLSLFEYHKNSAALAYNKEKALELDNEKENSVTKKYKKSLYTNLNCYVHNLAKFDGVFLLARLIELVSKEDLKITRNKDRIIQIKIRLNIKVKNKGRYVNKKIHITLLDSYQLLPASLLSLSTSFSPYD